MGSDRGNKVDECKSDTVHDIAYCVLMAICIFYKMKFEQEIEREVSVIFFDYFALLTL